MNKKNQKKLTFYLSTCILRFMCDVLLRKIKGIIIFAHKIYWDEIITR